MKEAAGAFPGRNELWGGRLLWLREQQSLVRQEHPLQLAKRTGRLQRESQSTRARAHRGSTVLVIGPLRGIFVELREADKNASCGPILRKPSGCSLDLDNLAEGVVKLALLRCSVCKQRQTEHCDADHDFHVDETLPTWHCWYSLRRGVTIAVADLSDSPAAKGLLRHSSFRTTERHYGKDGP